LKFKAGLIGCGRIGSLLSEDKLREKPCTHAEAYYKSQGVELVCGADNDPERLKLFSDKWEVKDTYTDYKEMLSEKKLDIVSVATPVSTHAEIIEECAKAKVKVILCEKPLASNPEDAKKAYELCKKSGSLLIVNHSRRFSGDYLKVRDLLSSGIIGKLKTVLCNISAASPEPGESFEKDGGGILMHDGTHLVDTLRFLLDEENPEEIFAFLKPASNDARVEENIQCVLRYKEGYNVFIDCSNRDYFHFEIDLQGDKGRITIGNAIHRYYVKGSSTHYENFNSLIEKPFPDYDKTPFFKTIVGNIVKYLKTGEIPESSGEQAYNTLMQVMSIYKSAAEKKVVRYPAEITEHPLKVVF
jgi:predicted dehydrogenase